MEKNAAAPAPAGRSIAVPLLLAVNVLALGAGAAAFWFLRPHPVDEGRRAAAGAAADPRSAMGPTLHLPDFVVRLRNPDSDRYARVSFEFELTAEESRAEVQRYLPRVRDLFIAYLSDRTVEELLGSEGLERTKTALVKSLDGPLPAGLVRSLYVTDFVIQ